MTFCFGLNCLQILRSQSVLCCLLMTRSIYQIISCRNPEGGREHIGSQILIQWSLQMPNSHRASSRSAMSSLASDITSPHNGQSTDMQQDRPFCDRPRVQPLQTSEALSMSSALCCEFSMTQEWPWSVSPGKRTSAVPVS